MSLIQWHWLLYFVWMCVCACVWCSLSWSRLSSVCTRKLLFSLLALCAFAFNEMKWNEEKSRKKEVYLVAFCIASIPLNHLLYLVGLMLLFFAFCFKPCLKSAKLLKNNQHRYILFDANLLFVVFCCCCCNTLFRSSAGIYLKIKVCVCVCEQFSRKKKKMKR